MSRPTFVGYVSSVNSFSKPLRCYSGLPYLGVIQKPNWNLGTSPHIVQFAVLITVNLMDGLLKGMCRTSYTDLKNPAFQFSRLILTQSLVGKEQQVAFLQLFT